MTERSSMSNNHKKEYVKPEITGVKMLAQANLLQGSCVGDGCAHGEWKD
jgi:hypothetical protein